MEDVLMEGRRGEPGGEACPPAPRYKGKMELFKPAGGFLSEQGCFSRNRTVVSHEKLASPLSFKKTVPYVGFIENIFLITRNAGGVGGGGEIGE